MGRVALAALVCAALVVGVLAEQQAYAWTELRYWLPDLLAGWTLIGLGIALLALRRSHRTAALLLAAGFSWFAFNFETTGPAFVQWFAVRAAYLHRGPLLQLALAPPDGRPRTRLSAGGVALAWTAAVLWPLWDADVAALMLAAVIVAIAAASQSRVQGRGKRAIAARGSAAAAVLAAAIAADAVRSIAGASGSATDATVLAYAGAVVVAGVLLFAAAALDVPATLAERVVALGRGGARLRDALRDLLGDGQLELGFVVGPGPLVDDVGEPLAPTSPGQAASPVTVAGRQVGVVAHDPATLEDDATRSAVLAAVGLAAERARLGAEASRQADAVDASRRRLLLAEEEERRRLAERLDRGTGLDLTAVERLVRDAQRVSGADAALAAALERATEQLERVRPELEAPVRGFKGFDASGLVPALERLAAGMPVEAQLELAEVTAPPEVRSALWFVCSESLANVVKHAAANSVRVSLGSDNGMVCLTVEDDGRGGADPHGSGLVGLADRVSALGGRLAVSSPPGGGTRISAELPVSD